MEAVHVAEEEMADSLFRISARDAPRGLAKRRQLRESRAIMGAVVDRVRNRACSGTLLQALKELDLSPDDMRDEILLLLLAGHHTTGNAAAWLLYYLATEPGLAARLAEEMQAITSD